MPKVGSPSIEGVTSDNDNGDGDGDGDDNNKIIRPLGTLEPNWKGEVQRPMRLWGSLTTWTEVDWPSRLSPVQCSEQKTVRATNQT